MEYKRYLPSKIVSLIEQFGLDKYALLSLYLTSNHFAEVEVKPVDKNILWYIKCLLLRVDVGGKYDKIVDYEQFAVRTIPYGYVNLTDYTTGKALEQVSYYPVGDYYFAADISRDHYVAIAYNGKIYGLLYFDDVQDEFYTQHLPRELKSSLLKFNADEFTYEMMYKR